MLYGEGHEGCPPAYAGLSECDFYQACFPEDNPRLRGAKGSGWECYFRRAG